MASLLNKHRQIWQKKKILRVIYTQWYTQLLKDLSPLKGKVLEIGSGSGNLKDFKPDIISSDINPAPWLDMCFDAHHIPFPDSSLSNIVMVDVLHHLQDPILFLQETKRVLKKGGRLIMIEPYPTFFSLLIYKRFHPEPFFFNHDYFKMRGIKGSRHKNPWDSNQAIPYLLFFKFQRQLGEVLQRQMQVIKKEKMSFLLYPLSGGFEHRSLIPSWSIPFFSGLEYILQPFKSLLAFRCYLIIERID